MRDFRTLTVWVKAHRLVLDIYQVTKAFPKDERFGLTSQMRRSAASICANIAEGCGRGRLDFARFVQIALGSASELEYHVILCGDLHLIDKPTGDRIEGAVTEVKRMMTGLMQTLKRSAFR